MKSNERKALLHCICETSFYIDDLRLFLDTHPCNKEALAAYRDFVCYRMELIKEYEECFGPLTSYGENYSCEQWLWVCDPWPWEGVC